MITFGKMTASNFGPFETLDFDWSRPGLTLIGGKNQDTTAASSNGSGKSNLIRCLIWTLFRETIEPGNYSIVRTGTDKAWAELEIRVDGRLYLVRREQAKVRSRLDLFVLESEVDERTRVSGATQTATQAEIERLLGMDLDTMRATVIYAQNDIRRFADPRMTDKDRKSILKKAVHLELLDEALAVAKQRKSEISEEIRELHTKLLALDSRRIVLVDGVDPVTVIRLREQRAGMQSRADEIAELEALVAEAQAMVSANTEAQQSLLRLRSQRAELSERIRIWRDEELAQAQRGHRAELAVSAVTAEQDRWEKAIQQLEGTRQKIVGYSGVEELLTDTCAVLTGLMEEQAAVVAEMQQAEGERTVLARQVEHLAANECPTCGTPTTAATVRHKVGEMQARLTALYQTIQFAQDQQGSMRDDIARVQREKQILETRVNESRALRVIEKQLMDSTQSPPSVDVAELLPTLEECREAEKIAREAGKAAQTEMLVLDTAIQTAEAEQEEMRGIERGVQEAQTELVKIRGEMRAIDILDQQIAVETKRAEEARQAIADVTEKIEGVAGEKDKWDRELSCYEFWVDGFGNAGMPSMLLDNVVDELAADANRYLDILADGDLRVSFDTQTMLKSGEVRDRFAVLVDVERAGNVQPSGGQLKKIEIACDLALMDLVARRERTGIDMLVLDECLDGLDAEGQSRVVDLLMHLRGRRRSIFVISHTPALPDVFETVVTVVKENGVSRLTNGVGGLE